MTGFVKGDSVRCCMKNQCVNFKTCEGKTGTVITDMSGGAIVNWPGLTQETCFDRCLEIWVAHI